MVKKLTKEEVIKALSDMEVSFDPEASYTELSTLLKESTADVDTSDEEVTESVADSSHIVFHMKNGTERVFSKDVHGDTFAEIASEFQATNADQIIAE